jgi:hypothetical protein
MVPASRATRLRSRGHLVGPECLQRRAAEWRTISCGGKGATLQRPGWAQSYRLSPFPMSVADENAQGAPRPIVLENEGRGRHAKLGLRRADIRASRATPIIH